MRKLAAIARTSEEMSNKLTTETIHNKEEPDLIVNGNKIAILFRQCKPNGGPSFIL
jgi:hypothetical protein